MRAFLHLAFCCLIITMVGLAHAESNLREIGQTIEDSVITTKITAKFAKNSMINPLKIHVNTNKGVVTLSGYVKDNERFVEVLRLTKSTAGVEAVETDELVIKQVNTALTDAYITAKVEAAVLKAKVFDDESIPIVGINATTSNGSVTLSGEAKTTRAVLAIIKRVTAVQGVKIVISRLKVNDQDS